ncbi:hypothetical protein BAE44_0015056 [Dichanthelium oligosanthes]|uniref:Protein kinase domain-containing protein n=1 Tax=Dichanthelium oligosanthes TaxID=888268 RepID=A0A1E5VFW0_9POAL|nr:hypothetical protein BAE44_0015056 [Dichanthelium oligosanthes]
MRQLLRAAEKLHATGTIHRDINPDNILVASDGALKICGFGCATRVVDLRDDLITMESEAFDGMLELSLAVREVLAGLLNFESYERLTAADALKHRWFTQEDVELEAKPPAAVEYPGFVPLFSVA